MLICTFKCACVHVCSFANSHWCVVNSMVAIAAFKILHYHNNFYKRSFSSAEHVHSTSRVIFLTDLCSTVDSVNDEKKLLSTIKQNADRGIYTTVVGIGMVSVSLLFILKYRY